MMTSRLLIPAALALALAMSACGKKGDLVLPPPTQPSNAPTSNVP